MKTSITNIICETAPEIKALSNCIDFRNMPVVFGVAVVISLVLNGKWQYHKPVVLKFLIKFFFAQINVNFSFKKINFNKFTGKTIGTIKYDKYV